LEQDFRRQRAEKQKLDTSLDVAKLGPSTSNDIRPEAYDVLRGRHGRTAALGDGIQLTGNGALAGMDSGEPSKKKGKTKQYDSSTSGSKTTKSDLATDQVASMMESKLKLQSNQDYTTRRSQVNTAARRGDTSYVSQNPMALATRIQSQEHMLATQRAESYVLSRPSDNAIIEYYLKEIDRPDRKSRDAQSQSKIDT
jgi:hypothetical protein